MVTLKLLGNGNVEVSILVAIVSRKMGNFASGAGFTPKDLESCGFNVIMSVEQAEDFYHDFLLSYRDLLKKLREKDKLREAGNPS
jgi:hypothetical protein